AKLSGFDLDKSSVKLVINAKNADDTPITETVKVKVKDQYGDALKNSGQDVKIKVNKLGVAKLTVNDVDVDFEDSNKLVSVDNVNNDGELSLVFSAEASDASSAIFTVEVGTYKKTISVSA